MSKKVAFITGGSTGLGFSLSKQLLKVGWSVIVDARNSDGLLDAARQDLSQLGQVICVEGDISDVNHVREVFELIKAQGRLDLIVNNASTLGVLPLRAVLDYSLDEIKAAYEINFFSPINVIQTLKEFFTEGMKIINVTSDAGKEPYSGWGIYGSSKAALEHISAVLALENPSFNIYWIDPGEMQTRMKHDADPSEDVSNLPVPDKIVPAFMKLISENFVSGRYEAHDLIQATE